MLLQRKKGSLGPRDSPLVSPSSCSSLLLFAPPLLVMLRLSPDLLSSQHPYFLGLCFVLCLKHTLW